MALGSAEATAMTGPDTIDCIAPADRWERFWRDAAAAKRRGAAWLRAIEAESAPTGIAPSEARS
jgi:hypothetical protein